MIGMKSKKAGSKNREKASQTRFIPVCQPAQPVVNADRMNMEIPAIPVKNTVLWR
jgi:hypothetical protein